MPPRRAVHCGYCREAGHNIAGCDIYKIKLDLTIIRNDLDILERHNNPTHIRTVSINVDNLTNIKLLFEGHLPYIIRKNYIIRKINNEQDNTLIIEEKNKIEIKQYKMELKELEKENNFINLNAITFINLKQRLTYYKQNCLYSYYISKRVLTELLNRNDYEDYIEEINTERTRRRDELRRIADEGIQQAEAILLARTGETINNTDIMDRIILPIIRETVIEADDCPICLETLIETNKSVLRCGHLLCTNCLVTQTLINFKKGMCKCPVCRERFI